MHEEPEELPGFSQPQKLSVDEIQELLRPVRELSALWDIPLGAYLDHFLGDLALSNPDTGDNVNAELINFSQAGLFLQGSTNIFARKVKHLYDIAVNSATMEDDGPDKEGKKRRRRPAEWVVDDLLVPIEDPEEVNTTMALEDQEPRLEITTMPKVPFCLLISLDAPSGPAQTGTAVFRLDSVPDQEFGVILLDPSQAFRDLEPDVTATVAAPEFVPRDNDEPRPPMPDEDDDDDNLPAPPEPESEPEPELEPEPEPRGRRSGDDEDKDEESEGEKEPAALAMLNPDENRLAFASRPFTKMNLRRLRVPTGFSDEKIQKKTLTQRPFHDNIFSEIFEKVKAFRKIRIQEADRDILATLPRESGRDHVLENIDVYVEPPPMPDDDDHEEDLERQLPSAFQTAGRQSPASGDSRNAYTQLCQQFVRLMVEMGQQKVMRPISSRVLAEWEQRLTPRLEQELKRKPFDITEIREWIKDMLRSHGGEMTFKNLASGLVAHEVSRVFLSVLMLANTTTVRIRQEARGQDKEDFIIQLLKDAGVAEQDSDE
jgi:condensin-2 complex subunit H2